MSDVFILYLILVSNQQKLYLFLLHRIKISRYARIYKTHDIEYFSCILHIQQK